MSTTVLGRDPLQSTARSAPVEATEPKPRRSPAPKASAPSKARSGAARGGAAKKRGDKGGSSAAPGAEPSGAGAKREEAGTRRTARIASMSRAAMAGVVREAQGAKKARARRAHTGRRASEPTVRSPISAPPSPAAGEVDIFGRDHAFVDRALPLLEFLCREYFRVHLQNSTAIPSAGRAIIVANHAGTLPYDGLMLMTALRAEHPRHRPLRPLIEDFPWHTPYLGVLLRSLGCVRSDQENAERLLAQEQVVAVFPEGAKGIGKLYRDRYKLQRFGRGGFIKLAMRTGSPVVPAAIIGAEEIHPLIGKVTWLVRSLGLPYFPITPTFPWLGALGLIPFPSKWSIELGEPIDMAGYTPDDAEDLVLVNRLTEQVRQSIQGMLDAKLALRQSVLFG